jgi:multidrug efflux system outer membrane protein
LTESPSTLLAAGLAAVLLAGCEVGPDYRRPAEETPPSFQETVPWKVAAPRDQVPKADWWRMFADPTLDRLETSAGKANPDVQAALARVEQARAIAQLSLDALLPGVNLNPTASRERYAEGRSLPPGSPEAAYTANSFDLSLVLNYEVDLFGRARRELEGARALAEAQADAYDSVLLSLQAEVAQDYFTLRGLVTQRTALLETVSGREEELDLVRKRRQAGANDDLDVYRAQTELASAQSAELAVEQQMATLRHALATLLGQAPEGFTLAATPLVPEPPAVPVGLPSDLLERRPDIAQAERTMAAASAGIGVAKSALFPVVGLTASGGFNNETFSKLFDSGSREWTLAPFASLPLYQPGNWANYRRAKFVFDEATATYRGQVLAAFRDVEDSVSALRYLADQAAVTKQGVTASRQAARLSLLRYKQGITDYFEVIDAQRTLLDLEIQDAQLETGRFVSTVLLVKALGGGWQ